MLRVHRCASCDNTIELCRVNRFYVRCSVCAAWFHGSCVGIADETAASSRAAYVCHNCCSSREPGSSLSTGSARIPARWQRPASAAARWKSCTVCAGHRTTRHCTLLSIDLFIILLTYDTVWCHVFENDEIHVAQLTVNFTVSHQTLLSI